MNTINACLELCLKGRSQSTVSLGNEAHPKFNFKSVFATIKMRKSALCKGVMNPGEVLSFLDSVNTVL